MVRKMQNSSFFFMYKLPLIGPCKAPKDSECVHVHVLVHAKPHHQPPALLTAFRTLRTFCAITDVLLADAVLVCLAVTSWTCTDASLETPATQNLTTGRGTHTDIQCLTHGTRRTYK